MSVTDKNRLSITHPTLRKEWDYEKNGDLKPEDVSYGSGRKVWWKCKNGHGWEAQIGQRSEGGKTGCPYCSGHRVSNKNRLSIRYPNLLKEWDYDKNKINPIDLPFCSTEMVWWKCGKGHEWQAIVYSRSKNQNGCPICMNQKVDKSNCIATTHPHLIKEWHSTKNGHLTPYDVVIGSEKMIWWICGKGHEYAARPSYKKRSIGECPYCNGIKVCKETSLAIANPSLAADWHPTKNNDITPYDVFPSTNKLFWWKCKRGHEWQSTSNNRSKGNGCPICSRVVLKDGTIWDSYTEAYVYLKFKHRGFVIEPHKKYCMGKSVCDFYLPQFDLYCEITSFSKDDIIPVEGLWKTYMKKIRKKREWVQNHLGANFRFISIKKLNRTQKLQVIREIDAK